MKKVIIIIILLIIVGAGIIFGMKFFGKENGGINNIFDKTTYKEYKTGDFVKFNDSLWYVVYNSDKNTDYVTLISSDIISLEDNENAISGIYETSKVNYYLKNDYAKELGEDKLVERNGYKVRLLNKSDFDYLVNEENLTYNEKLDEYDIKDCPEFLCLTNTFYGTMIDTTDNKEVTDAYYNVDDIDNVRFGEYTLHLNYYNITTTYETFKLNSVTENASLFVRPVINVYKKYVE